MLHYLAVNNVYILAAAVYIVRFSIDPNIEKCMFCTCKCYILIPMYCINRPGWNKLHMCSLKLCFYSTFHKLKVTAKRRLESIKDIITNKYERRQIMNTTKRGWWHKYCMSITLSKQLGFGCWHFTERVPPKVLPLTEDNMNLENINKLDP